jgi:hypothetical protein
MIVNFVSTPSDRFSIWSAMLMDKTKSVKFTKQTVAHWILAMFMITYSILFISFYMILMIFNTTAPPQVFYGMMGYSFGWSIIFVLYEIRTLKIQYPVLVYLNYVESKLFNIDKTSYKSYFECEVNLPSIN